MGMKDKDIIKGLIRHKDNKLAAEILVALSVGCRLSSKDRKNAIDIINGIDPERKPDENQLLLIEKLKVLVPNSERGKFIDEMIGKGNQFPWTHNQKLTVKKIIDKKEKNIT